MFDYLRRVKKTKTEEISEEAKSFWAAKEKENRVKNYVSQALLSALLTAGFSVNLITR